MPKVELSAVRNKCVELLGFPIGEIEEVAPKCRAMVRFATSFDVFSDRQNRSPAQEYQVLASEPNLRQAITIFPRTLGAMLLFPSFHPTPANATA